MGFGTRELTERAGKFPTFVAALATATQGRMIPSPGGVLIIDAEGQVIGAAGISGDTGPMTRAAPWQGSWLPGSARSREP